MLSSAESLYAYSKLMNYLHTQKFYVRNVMRNCKDFTRLVDFFFLLASTFTEEKYNHKLTILETKIFLMKQWVVIAWVFIVFTECNPLLIFG